MKVHNFINIKNETKEWLFQNAEIAEKLFVVYEDAINVNPVEGKPYLKLASQCLDVVKIAVENNLISGPYNEEHFQKIQAVFNIPNFNQSTFWNIFSHNCASKKMEDNFTIEQLYFTSLNEIVVLIFIENVSVEDIDVGEEIFDMNQNKIIKLNAKGSGVNAAYKF